MEKIYIKNSILIVGGSRKHLDIAKNVVERSSNTAYITRSTHEACDILFNKQVDAILIMAGFGHFIELIRKFTTIPCTYVQCGNCIQPGGIEFVVKVEDFSYDYIPQYLNKMLQETKKRSKFKGIIWFKRLKVDMDNYTIKYKSRQIKMKPLEIKLLFYMLKFLNRVVSRDELLKNVWRYQKGGVTRTLDVHIMALRSLIDEYYMPLKIVTIRSRGYKLIDKQVNGGKVYLE